MKKNKKNLLLTLLMMLVVFSPAIYYGLETIRDNNKLTTCNTVLAQGNVCDVRVKHVGLFTKKRKSEVYAHAEYYVNGEKYAVESGEHLYSEIPYNTPILVEYVENEPWISRIILKDTVLFYSDYKFEYYKLPRKFLSTVDRYKCRYTKLSEQKKIQELFLPKAANANDK